MKWSDAFLILEKYGVGQFDICADHDVLYINLAASYDAEHPLDFFQEEDYSELVDFGFFANEDEGTFCIYV